jgi:hypothetical protein
MQEKIRLERRKYFRPASAGLKNCSSLPDAFAGAAVTVNSMFVLHGANLRDRTLRQREDERIV